MTWPAFDAGRSDCLLQIVAFSTYTALTFDALIEGLFQYGDVAEF